MPHACTWERSSDDLRKLRVGFACWAYGTLEHSEIVSWTACILEQPHTTQCPRSQDCDAQQGKVIKPDQVPLKTNLSSNFVLHRFATRSLKEKEIFTSCPYPDTSNSCNMSVVLMTAIFGALALGQDSPIRLCTESACDNCPNSLTTAGTGYPSCVIYDRDTVLGGTVDQYEMAPADTRKIFYDIGEILQAPTTRFVSMF